VPASLISGSFAAFVAPLSGTYYMSYHNAEFGIVSLGKIAGTIPFDTAL